MAATAFRRMRIAFTLAAMCLILPVLTNGGVIDQRTTWRFDDVPAGRPPSGFVFASSAKEQAVPWVAARDGANGVLAHASEGTPALHLAVAEGTSFGDVVLSARMRVMDGARSAGLVWRYRDSDNYYVTTLDVREQEVRIYRVVAGNRTRLGDEDDLELDANAWHVLKVEHRGTRMRVWIDGVPVSNARDRTWQDPGAIGLWTSGDSTAWFDDLSVEPAPADRDRERSGRRN